MATMIVEESARRPASAEDRSSRRWISRRLDQLDPVRDYAEIIKLTSVFYMSPFIMDWAFVQSMPRFNLGPSGAALSRGGTGKLFTDTGRRYEDTAAHGVIWAEFGPESPETRRSLDAINGLHAKWQKQYPAEFDDLDLWVYVIAFQVCGASLLFSQAGVPPPSDKEKIARVIFGQKLAEQFIYIDGRRLSEVMPRMDGYEQWLEFWHAYEAKAFEYCQQTTDCLVHIIDSFGGRSSLPDWFARALVTAFWHDGLFRYTGIGRPGRLMRFAARTYMKGVMLKVALKRDPKESYPEMLRRRAAETGSPLNPILKTAQLRPRGGGTMCPMGFGTAVP